MSAASVPYHLRPNKFVDRVLFVELLGIVDSEWPLAEAVYVSMGGRLLEDHRLIHRRFRTRKLLSIDMDPDEVERQEFNRPYPFIQCRELTAEDLAVGFDAVRDELDPGGDKEPAVTWLDYTDPKGLLAQLGGVVSLVSKLQSRDVVKVTLNVSRRALSDKVKNAGMSQLEVDQGVVELLQSRLGEYWSGRKLDPARLREEDLAKEVAAAVGSAALKGTAGSRHLRPHVLSSFRYKDAFHQMVTVTFVVADDADWKSLEKRLVGPAGSTEETHAAEKDADEEVEEPETSAEEESESGDSEEPNPGSPAENDPGEAGGEHKPGGGEKSAIGPVPLRPWEFCPTRWDDITEINLPELSIREQIYISQLLDEEKTKAFATELDFPIDERQIREFDRHYRRYPTFVPISF